jgi:hypothetical protein
MSYTEHETTPIYYPKASYPQGTMKIVSASHPDGSVTVGKEYSWYVVGKATGGYVRNPAVVYVFVSSDVSDATVKLVKNDGSVVEKGWPAVVTVYLKGDQPEGTQVDSRSVYRGVIFTKPGTYRIVLSTGVLSDTEAATGTQYGNVFSLVESGYPKGFVTRYSVPLEISVNEPMAVIPSLIGAVVPVIVPLATIGINEMRKR